MLEIKQVTGEDIVDIALPINHYAFSPSPQKDKRDEWLELLPYLETSYIAVLFEEGVPAATARNLSMQENVRDKLYAMGGVAGVSVYPEHRRKGYARDIMQHIMYQSFEAGHTFSTLYPFKESFYERLGYVGFPQVRMVVLDPRHLTGLLKLDIPGSVEIRHITDGFDDYRAFEEAMLPQIHGMALRDDETSFKERAQYWLALARNESHDIIGMMVYKLEGYAKELYARRFLYSDSAGKYLLLQWLARHADQAYTAKIVTPPDSYVETWLTDLNAEVKTQSIPSGYSSTPMGRIIDIANIGGMTTGEGQFKARISDPYCDWNNGIFLFETRDGQLTVNEASSADSELTIQGLSALVYGGYDPGDFVYRDWSDTIPADVLHQMRSMFPNRLVFLHEEF
jgi:predicted acetyltransferase